MSKLTYERAKQLYMPYDEGQMRHLCALRDVEIDRLRAENAKLQELASILCYCMQIHTRCDDCKLNGTKGEFAHDPLLACNGLHALLCELGIEVPA